MRTIVLIVIVVVLMLFGILNINALTFPHTLSLGFVTYTGVPLGLILLLLGLALALVFYFWAGVSGLRAQANSAKLLRDMEALRVSLDSQEGSRFAQLQTHLDQRFGSLETQVQAPKALGLGKELNASDLAATNARIDALQRDLNLQLAQLDDYLKRKLG
ncbi:LapA family protein [Deinococcus oregonensis]|uniref:LapA family protein n=1 Tax=Deinococcus oregonensis TaxID=1805970 RepID=A0ABV6B236_9DEIO